MRYLSSALMAILFFCASAVYADRDIGSAVSTDDVCSIRPDLCSASMKRTKRRKGRTVTSTRAEKKKAKKNRQRLKMKDDADNEFFSKDKNTDENIESETTAELNRQPAFVEPERAAVAPAARATPRRKISFTNYLSANSGHPSLAVRRATRQDAFQPIARPSTLTGPANTVNPEVPDDPGAGSGQSVRENRAPQADEGAAAGGG